MTVFLSVVDDEEDLAYLFKDALSQIHGVNALAFSDPFVALEHFRLNHRAYRLVISDYRMPGMKIRIVKGDKEYRSVTPSYFDKCLRSRKFSFRGMRLREQIFAKTNSDDQTS